MFDWLKKKNSSKQEKLSPQRNEQPFISPADESPLTDDGSRTGTDPAGGETQVISGAQEELEKLHQKMDALAQRFANGSINRAQFQELFSYYQSKANDLATLLFFNPDSEDWKNLVSEGQSIIIRRRHAAKLNGFSIIDNRNGMPIKTIGDFGLDPALFVPMLFAYQSATKEIFGGSAKLTQIEDGRWLVFISGKITTTLALFSNEPSQKQQQTLQQVHKVFETANDQRLNSKAVDLKNLVIPHEYFLKHSL